MLLLPLLVACAPQDLPAGYEALPLLPPERREPERVDWLFEHAPHAAGVFRDEDGKTLYLDNGLLRRTFRVTPNGAAVGLDDLTTGEALLRAVRPEARLTIDGVDLEVGGLEGQPNHAYLAPEWLEKMQTDSGALVLQRIETGPIEARLDWKRVRHHAPDSEWPPRGVHLELGFRAGPWHETLWDPARTRGWIQGREQLWSENFETLDESWQDHRPSGEERASFQNEGKPGEIYARANTAVYAERSWPAEARAIEVVVDPGTDRSKSWGPGVALVWPDHSVKFNLRPGGNAYDDTMMFGVWDGAHEDAARGGRQELRRDVPWRLRVVLVQEAMSVQHVLLSARPEAPNAKWRDLGYTRVLTGDPPRQLRVGKLDVRGEGSHFEDPGEWGRCRIVEVTAWGDQKEPPALSRKLEDIEVTVHYALYDGIPAYSKWLTVTNGSEAPVTLDRFTSELLAATEHSSWVESRGTPIPHPELHVETDYAFGGMTHVNANRHAVRWVTDPEYTTQVNYLRNTPCLLEVGPELGPAQRIAPGETFETFRTFVLSKGRGDRERSGLAQRRLYRTVAPWVTENPLMMHVRWSDWETVKAAIDQCAAVGFEMVILTFGSGFNIEDDSPEYLAEMKRYADYARSKGVEIGGYSLLSSRRIQPLEDNCVHPETGAPGADIHGSCPSLTSDWGQRYFAKLYAFYEQTGFSLLEHDGPWPGTPDASARPPLQQGLEDSRWAQWRVTDEFYRWCRAQGIYLNTPDYYYLAGSTKCAMGYREVNWSLPRAQQVLHTRQNIYDGTWTKTPSMGWMFVPLTEYHGGGAAATIEPLSEHLDHYGAMLTCNLALGVQACYRGPRLFDTDATRDLVKERVVWFKQNRRLLESDVVHGRRADGRDLDWMLHVDPLGPTRGLLVVFNPLGVERTRQLDIDLHYTGIRGASARITDANGATRELPLEGTRASLEVTVPAQGMAAYWFE